jgi:hypothetical protein
MVGNWSGAIWFIHGDADVRSANIHSCSEAHTDNYNREGTLPKTVFVKSICIGPKIEPRLCEKSAEYVAFALEKPVVTKLLYPDCWLTAFLNTAIIIL